MAETRRAPVEVSSLSHYLRQVSDFGISAINSISIVCNFNQEVGWIASFTGLVDFCRTCSQTVNIPKGPVPCSQW